LTNNELKFIVGQSPNLLALLTIKIYIKVFYINTRFD